jgi:hypothetical protein
LNKTPYKGVKMTTAYKNNIGVDSVLLRITRDSSLPKHILLDGEKAIVIHGRVKIDDYVSCARHYILTLSNIDHAMEAIEEKII